METSNEWSGEKSVGPWVVACCPECKGISPDDGAVKGGLFGPSVVGHRPECSKLVMR